LSLTFGGLDTLGFIIVCLSLVGGGWAEDWIWLKAKINGKPAKLCFDSGADGFYLWRESAQRLGLAFTEADTNAVLAAGEVPVGWTEICKLSIFGKEVKTRFRVVDYPGVFDTSFDGMVGWPNLRNNIIQIDATGLDTNSDILALNVPCDNNAASVVLLDTGSEHGLALPRQAWRKWKLEHPAQLTTLNSFFTPAEGLLAKEEGWADRFNLGPLMMSGVPVTEATETDTALGGEHYSGSLGIAALKRLEFIVDGKHGIAYLHAKTAKAPPYRHNRAGVVFLPDRVRKDEFIARVVDGSPAYEAGIRDGDVLISIDEFEDITMSPIGALNLLWKPAGTKVKLKLRRGGKDFTTTVKLREILSSESPKRTGR